MSKAPPSQARPNSRYGRQQKQPAMEVATVIYGDEKKAVINLDCRLCDIHGHLLRLLGGIEGEADLVQIVDRTTHVMIDLQGSMAGPGVNADGDQLRSFDVIKPRVQYYLVQCRPDVDYQSIRDKASKTVFSAVAKKGSTSLTLPPDDKLWKKLYTIAHVNSEVLTDEVHLQLPNSVKERVLARVMEIEESEREATQTPTRRKSVTKKGK